MQRAEHNNIVYYFQIIEEKKIAYYNIQHLASKSGKNELFGLGLGLEYATTKYESVF